MRKVIKPTPLHTVLARHVSKTDNDGRPFVKYFTKMQWKLIGSTTDANGNTIDKQGWVEILEDSINPPPEAKEPFKVKPKVTDQVTDQVTEESDTDTIKAGNADKLPIRDLHFWVKQREDEIKDWMEADGKSSTGIYRLSKKKFVSLVTKFATENL